MEGLHAPTLSRRDAAVSRHRGNISWSGDGTVQGR
jgi:hypothetical protein